MTLHLIKLCVGADSIEDLAAWQQEHFGPHGPAIMSTRQTPRRAAELAGEGSLYWVIKGLILCRQGIIDVETVGEGPARRCRVLLELAITPTEPAPRRAFQGWRYFDGKDAPADLPPAGEEGAPPELARTLRRLGAW